MHELFMITWELNGVLTFTRVSLSSHGKYGYNVVWCRCCYLLFPFSSSHRARFRAPPLPCTLSETSPWFLQNCGQVAKYLSLRFEYIYICRSSSSNLLWIDENMFLILVDRLIGSVDTRTVQWIYLFEKWTSIEFIFLIWSCIRNNRDIDGNGNFNVAFSIKLVLNWVLFWWKRIIEIRNFWSKSSINFENCK